MSDCSTLLNCLQSSPNLCSSTYDCINNGNPITNIRISNPCTQGAQNQSSGYEFALAYSQGAASVISNPCNASASCGSISPIAPAISTLVNNSFQGFVGGINNVLNSDPCSLISSVNGGVNISFTGPLSSCVNPVNINIGSLVKNTSSKIIETFGASLNTTFSSASVCNLLAGNMPNLQISGPLASCGVQIPSIQMNGVAVLLKNLAKTVAQSIAETISYSFQTTSSCGFIDGVNVNLRGELGSCLPGISFQFGGPPVRGFIENVMDSVKSTMESVVANPCGSHTINGPCGITRQFDGSSMIDNLLSSQCFNDKIFQWISDKQCEIMDNLLGLPTNQCVVDTIKNLLESYRCEFFEKFIDSGGSADGCIKDSILEFTNANKCELFEKFIDSAGSADGCIKDSILAFTNTNKCELFEKFLPNSGMPTESCITNNIKSFVRKNACSILESLNSETVSSSTNTCQTHYNNLINSVLCGYLPTLGPQNPAYMCILYFINDQIEQYGKKIKICDDGVTKIIKVMTTIDESSGTTKYYSE